MVQYKVVKEFACGKKGDILTWNDETEMFEFYFKDETSERALFMDKDTCDEYVDECNFCTNCQKISANVCYFFVIDVLIECKA